MSGSDPVLGGRTPVGETSGMDPMIRPDIDAVLSLLSGNGRFDGGFRMEDGRRRIIWQYEIIGPYWGDDDPDDHLVVMGASNGSAADEVLPPGWIRTSADIGTDSCWFHLEPTGPVVTVGTGFVQAGHFCNVRDRRHCHWLRMTRVGEELPWGREVHLAHVDAAEFHRVAFDIGCGRYLGDLWRAADAEVPEFREVRRKDGRG